MSDAINNENNDDIRILTNCLINMLSLLGVLLAGKKTILTPVTKEEAETMIKNAITAYRETPTINTLKKEGVHQAIDRVHDKVYSDVARFFDEEISAASLTATSQAAFAAGAAFSVFPLVSVICDGTALAAMATVAGLEIALSVEGPKIVAEANGLKSEVDRQDELKPVKKWNNARASEILTLLRLNIGMPDYRGESLLYALIFVVDQKTPGLNDEQLFEEVKKLCFDVHDLSAKLPDLGDKLYHVVMEEDESAIKDAVQGMVEISAGIIPLISSLIGTLVLSVRLALNIKANYGSLKSIWNALMSDPIPDQMEVRWTRTLTTIEKVQAGIAAIAGIFGAAMGVWQAIKTAQQKSEALSTVDTNRDAVKTFYDSVMSHVHS